MEQKLLSRPFFAYRGHAACDPVAPHSLQVLVVSHFDPTGRKGSSENVYRTSTPTPLQQNLPKFGVSAAVLPISAFVSLARAVGPRCAHVGPCRALCACLGHEHDCDEQTARRVTKRPHEGNPHSGCRPSRESRLILLRSHDRACAPLSPSGGRQERAPIVPQSFPNFFLPLRGQLGEDLRA